MSDSDLTAALADFFAATWPTDAPVHEPGPLSESPWTAFADLGLHLVGVDESVGGSGGSFTDLVALAMLAGRHAADVPVVESTTAAWALERAGLPIDASASHSIPVGATHLSVHDRGTVRGTLTDVPWGASVDLVVAIADDGRTVVLRSSDASVRSGLDLAGQPRDTLTFDGATPLGVGEGATADQLRRRGASLRVAMTAGALQSIAELTRRYVSERSQFGKPIGSFQAVQAHVVELQQMAVMTTAVADRLALDPDLHPFDVMAAQIVAAENATAATAAAHQAHGAIGMTREYRLHALTRRLHTWSGDFGEVLDLSRRLGATANQSPSFAQLIVNDHRSEPVS